MIAPLTCTILHSFFMLKLKNNVCFNISFLYIKSTVCSNLCKHLSPFFRMDRLKINKSDNTVVFGQLLGMCDYISFTLGKTNCSM